MKLADSVFEELWFAEDNTNDASAEASASMAAKLAQVDGLKTFPVVAQKVLQLLSNPNFKAVEVTSAIQEDPSLAAGVLRLANSAFFSRGKPVTSVDRAFIRLGRGSVSEVVASVATMSMFPDVGGLGKAVRDHCAATAAIVQVLARDFTPKFTDGTFLAGLLHDVGKLLLIESGEIMYSTGNIQETMETDQLHIQERAILGYDHAVLAGHVLSKWQLPEPLPKTVAWHHQATRAYADADIGPIVAMLRLADQIDPILRDNREDYEQCIDALAEGPDCVFARVTADDLKARWSLLYKVRGDALQTFGG